MLICNCLNIFESWTNCLSVLFFLCIWENESGEHMIWPSPSLQTFSGSLDKPNFQLLSRILLTDLVKFLLTFFFYFTSVFIIFHFCFDILTLFQYSATSEGDHIYLLFGICLCVPWQWSLWSAGQQIWYLAYLYFQVVNYSSLILELGVRCGHERLCGHRKLLHCFF